MECVIMGQLVADLRSGSGWLPLLTLPVIAIGALISLWFPSGSLLVLKPALPKWGIISSTAGLKQAIVLSVATGDVREAIDVIDEEHVRTRAERDAFDAFIDCIKASSARSAPLPTNPQQSVVGVKTTQGNQLQELREAYRRTVMGVAHYDEEYDDTLTESLETEFGPELGSHLVSGQAFTPVVKQQLLKVAHQRRQAREEFLLTLEAEREALKGARSSLEGVAATLDEITASFPSDQSFSDLVQSHTRLDDAEQTCEALLNDRQRQRTDRQAVVDTSKQSVHDFYSYLYQPLSVTYPVLADTTNLLETLQEARKQLTRELATQY
jgi:hypothetical protein